MDQTILFILLLIAAAILIVSFTHISLLILSATKWKRQAEVYRRHEKIAADREKHDSSHDNNSGAPADMAALIDAIKAEGRANRAEEQREDDAGNLREWLTIVLIALTLIAVGWQVNEMVKVYGPIKDQADAAKATADQAKRSADAAIRQSIASENALIQAQRAWVGPRNASITAEPTIGKPVEFNITYDNTGREPALGFVYAVDAFRLDPTNQYTGLVTMQDYMTACRARTDWQSGSVIYPATNGFGSGYNISGKTKDDFTTDKVVKGDEIIVIQGCFAYKSFSAPRHSYFCYFYKQGFTKTAALNICDIGHDAD